VWRSLVALFAMVVTTVGGASASARDASARLTLETRTGSVTSVLVPTEATLTCDRGARGTGFVRRAATPACALVRTGVVGKIAALHRGPRLCAEMYGGPQHAHVHGTVGGRRVDMAIDRGDGCGIDDWNKLQALLGDPERRGAIPRPGAATPTTTTTTSPPTTYRVQRGDTLTTIARHFRTSVSGIVAANQLTDPDNLTEGQDLVMPPPSDVRIEAQLAEGGTRAGFDLTLVGAAPSELVTFVITLPDGSTYTGSPHVASGYGVVTTTYSGVIGAGTYTVTADGEQGTTAQANFSLVQPD
jgi:LysM repeat protein